MITPTSCYTCDMLHDIFIRIRDDVVDVQWVILVVWYATCVMRRESLITCVIMAT